MEGKKTLLVAVLVVVIIVAGVMIFKRTTSAPTVPDWVLDQKVDKIDIKSLDVSTASLRDWMGKYAANASGQYKSPKTGEYTMVDIMTCANCGKQIPAPPVPPEIMNIKDPMERETAMAKFRKEYACPYCKKSPFPGGM